MLSSYHRVNGTECSRPDQKKSRLQSTKRIVMLTVTSLFCLAILISSLLSLNPTRSVRAETAAVAKPAIGINVDDPQYDMFTDAFKTSNYQWDRADGTSGNAPIDSNGWPTTDAGIYVWQGESFTDGTYQLSFNGQATINHPGTDVQISNQQYNAGSNTTTATLVVPATSSGPTNFYLQFTGTKRTAASATDTGITNVRMMKPVDEGSSTSFDPSTIFTPWIINAVQPYNHLRFMFGTNWNKSVNWSDRTRVDYATQHPVFAGENGFEGNQMAFEYMVALANATNKDLYVVVPDRANNDYITKLAQLILYGSDGVNPYTSSQSSPVWAPLKSSLNVFVEYTNEAWNFQFDQAHDLYDGPIGWQQEIQNNPSSPLNYDGQTDGNVLWHRNYAMRALNVSKIFRSVFGDSAMISRVRPLIYWQYSNLNNTAEDELQFLFDYYNNADGVQHVSDPHPLSYYFWGGGGAVYFNSNNDNASTVDALFASGIPQSGYQNMLNVESRWAHEYGLHFMSYEGSWGITGTVGDQGRVDSRAQQALVDSFNDFARAGGDLYTAGTFGQWNNLRQASTYPLVKGAAQINSSSFTPAAINQGIGTSTSSATFIPGPHYSMSRTWPSGPATSLGKVTSYLLHITGSGTYQIAVNVSNAAAGGKINVYVDSVLLSTISVPATGSGSSQTVVAGSTSLTPGLHSVMLRASANASGGNAGTVNTMIVQPGTGTPPSIPAPGALPSGWQSQDIGSVGQTGYASSSNGTISVAGSGYDIWNTVDAFHYVYQQVTGDTTIIARVAFIGDSNSYAKAGVMIRKSLDASAANAIVYYSPIGDTTFEDRTTDSGNTNHPDALQQETPSWVKLVRSGNTFTGYVSRDGQNWTQVGSDTITMNSSVYVGLAVSAHDDGTLMMTDFDTISVNGSVITPTPTPTPTTTPTPTPTTTPTPTPTTTPTPTPGGSLLASDDFSAATGPLHNANSGSGWAGAWNEQNGSTAVPGYNISNSSPLSYSTLSTSGNYATGGYSYETAGRSLNVSSSGPFSAYLNSNGQIGAAGKSLYVSILLRKDANNDEENSLTLHNNNTNWCAGCASSAVGIGYFGSSSNSGSTRYWSLKVNGTVYRSNQAVTVGQTALLVLRIDFGSTTNLSLYVNPASLGGSAPASTDAQASTSSVIELKSVAYYGGDSTGSSSIDEIRFGDSFGVVTPSSSGSSSGGWTKCADEGGACSFSGTMVVRYGANGSYAYQTATGSIGCNNTVFGDPIPGTVKSCYVAPVPPTSWTNCASEGGTCNVPGTVTVAYGANSSYAYKTVTGSIGCNNTVFGDPAYGTPKACYYK